MISIEKFQESDQNDVIELTLYFQNDGTRPMVSIKDQPDLLHITNEYIDAGGYFWVAKDHGKLVGTIGLMPYSDKTAILKKFFVCEEYQGEPCHLGQKLYAGLLQFAKDKGFELILLDTPKNTYRAHRFYEKAGFRKISEDELPAAFDHPYQDCDFFLLEL